jgi:hypothetical protein
LKSPLFTAVICLFFSQPTCWGQIQRPTKLVDHVSQLADEKIEVSKLDWIMLTARLRMLEQIFAHESSRTVSPVGMDYDAERKHVVIKGFVDSDWIAGAKMDEAKNTLLKEARSYCVDGLALAEGEGGELIASTNVKDDCSVHFFTWIAKGGRMEPKDIALFENNELLLK